MCTIDRKDTRATGWPGIQTGRGWCSNLRARLKSTGQRPSFAVTGFDENRCRQAVEYYEPARVVVAAQLGEQYSNDARNVGSSIAGSIPSTDVQVDAFHGDHGYSALREHVEKLARKHNVILCSFGPKPSAIALYRLQREFPQTALAYIGCKEYNVNYSDGLGDAIEGAVEWRKSVER